MLLERGLECRKMMMFGDALDGFSLIFFLCDFISFFSVLFVWLYQLISLQHKSSFQ